MIVVSDDKGRLREWFIYLAEKCFRLPYIYGGQSIKFGVDCSGLVVECLRRIGMIGFDQDFTADGLWMRYSGSHSVYSPRRGALTFWFDRGKAVHVAICLDNSMTIQAARGGSHVKTVADSDRHKAYVDYIPVNYRPGPVRFVDIFQ